MQPTTRTNVGHMAADDGELEAQEASKEGRTEISNYYESVCSITPLKMYFYRLNYLKKAERNPPFILVYLNKYYNYR